MIKTSILALFSLLFMIFHAGLVTKVQQPDFFCGILQWYRRCFHLWFCPPFSLSPAGSPGLCSRLRWFSVSAGCQQTMVCSPHRAPLRLPYGRKNVRRLSRGKAAQLQRGKVSLRPL